MSQIETLPGLAVDPKGRFKHVMALALNPKTDYQDGVIRVITSREGSVDVSGFIDRSQLYRVAKVTDGSQNEYRYDITEPLLIQNQDTRIGPLLPQGFEFLGLEDPDLIMDANGTLHLYCTIPLINRAEGMSHIYLGHAEGDDLDTLCMTEPVLMGSDVGAKEVSLVPRASDGIYRHLIESSAPGTEFSAYSTVRVAKARDFSGPWEFGDTIFHPAHADVPWTGGHASPGPLLPTSFIQPGEGKLVFFLNGRTADKVHNEQVIFGVFSIGVAIYDYEHGEICGVSRVPFIEDADATTITFASQFIQTGPEEGILYAHVDDSFVRAYRITKDAVLAFMQESIS